MNPFSSNVTSWAGKRVLVLSPSPTHPQDFGSRRRFFAVCSALKERGAIVDLVLYPSEVEWQHRICHGPMKDMAEAWNSVHLIAPTVPPHSYPQGDHHHIDSWWDEAIGHYLMWKFNKTKYDIFIVNYTWLSKALDYAPKGVVKILDTIDKFAGRKELLQSNGIEPEYFYLADEKQEAIGLERADIVWAIKEQEAAYFKRLTQKPVFSLPHADPAEPVSAIAPDKDGYLRVGLIGADNNINRVNFNSFLKLMVEQSRKMFAPIKIVIAGGICKSLQQFDSPIIESIGRVEDVADFYRQIDVAIIPIEFSTGLKIKTGEALGFGVPVVSTAHAFEGYSSRRPEHNLKDMPAVVKALIELSFAQSRLPSLRNATLLAYTQTSKTADEALDKTIELAIKQRPTSLHLCSANVFKERTGYAIAASSFNTYLSYLAGVDYYIATGRLTQSASLEACLDVTGRIFVDVSVDVSSVDHEVTAGRIIVIDKAKAFLSSSGYKLVFVDCLMSIGLTTAIRQSGIPVVTRLATMNLSEDDDIVRTQVEQLNPTLMIGLHDNPPLRKLAAQRDVRYIQVPAVYGGRNFAQNALHRKAARAFDVVILAQPELQFGALLDKMIRQMGLLACVVTATPEHYLADVEKTRAGVPARSAMTPDAYLTAILESEIDHPRVVVDCSRGSGKFMLLQEILSSLKIPLIAVDTYFKAQPIEKSGQNHYVSMSKALELVTTHMAGLSDILLDLDHAEYANKSDSGWAGLWRLSSAALHGEKGLDVDPFGIG